MTQISVNECYGHDSVILWAGLIGDFEAVQKSQKVRAGSTAAEVPNGESRKVQWM